MPVDLHLQYRTSDWLVTMSPLGQPQAEGKRYRYCFIRPDPKKLGSPESPGISVPFPPQTKPSQALGKQDQEK